MILFSCCEKKEEFAQNERTGRRAWRWVLRFELLEIWIERQINYYDQDNLWRSDCEYFGVYFSRRFRFGFESFYYNGPHNIFSLGWLRLEWGL